MPRDPDVADLLSDHGDDVVATAERVRAAIRAAHPQLTERVRHGWHSINYRDPVAGYVCGIFPSADRVQLAFERGAALPDPHRLLSGTGSRVRSLVFRTADDVDEDVVAEYVDLAVELGAALRRR